MSKWKWKKTFQTNNSWKVNSEDHVDNKAKRRIPKQSTPFFWKNEHLSSYVCVSGGKKGLFSGKFGVF